MNQLIILGLTGTVIPFLDETLPMIEHHNCGTW